MLDWSTNIQCGEVVLVLTALHHWANIVNITIKRGKLYPKVRPGLNVTGEDNKAVKISKVSR